MKRLNHSPRSNKPRSELIVSVRLNHPLAATVGMSRMFGFIPFLILLAAVAIGCHRVLQLLFWTHDSSSRGLDSYAYWISKDNYLTSGFTRRGLGSTIFALLDHGAARISLPIFSLICAAFLSIPLAAFLFKLVRIGGWKPYWLALILLVSPQMFRSWGMDIGRGDMLSTAFVAWALLATLDRRYLLTAVVLLVGSLNHEAVLILGVPLCATFWFLDWRERRAAFVQGVRAMAVLATGVIALTILQHVFSASPQQIAKAIAAGPIPDPSSWLRAGVVDQRLVASYMTAGGFRTLATSNCMMYSSPGAYIYPLSCFATLFFYLPIYNLTSKVGVVVFGVACLLPMMFLSIVAIDYGRWLDFAVMNGWLATAALCIRDRTPAPTAKWRYAISGIALLPLLVLGPADVFTSSYRIRELGVKIYGPSMNYPSSHLPECDPQWKAVAQGTGGK